MSMINKQHERRDYQERAIYATTEFWNAGGQSVCLVMPTGSGKTHVGCRLMRGRRTLWVGHGRELVEQAAEAAAAMYGQDAVSICMPGGKYRPRAPLQFATVQTLLARDVGNIQVELVVIDECHHYAADRWSDVPAEYQGIPRLGLTATPERGDGRPLNHMFEHMIVGARYPELVQSGVLVPWLILQPPKHLGHDYATEPLAIWLGSPYGRRKTFAYFRDISEAESAAGHFRAAGVRAQTINCETPRTERDKWLSEFRRGALLVITNVYTMVEGVNVPDVGAIMLASNFETAGRYIQACGRGGRAAPGKEYAVLFDLCGASRKHGNPHQDWEFSLDGKEGIRSRSNENVGELDLPSKEREQPISVGSGLIVADCSTWVPSAADPSPIPESMLYRPNAERQQARMKRELRRRGGKALDVIARITGGLAE